MFHQSYKIRLHALPILSIVYYRELPLVDEEMAANIMDVSVARQEKKGSLFLVSI
jgi:hypothetical protein